MLTGRTRFEIQHRTIGKKLAYALLALETAEDVDLALIEASFALDNDPPYSAKQVEEVRSILKLIVQFFAPEEA